MMSEERSQMEADAKAANKRRADAWISQCLPEVSLLEHEKAVWLQLRNARQRKRRAHNALLRSMAPMPFEEWDQMEQQAQAEREQLLQEKAQVQLQRQALESAKDRNVGVFLKQQLSGPLSGKLRPKVAKMPSQFQEHPPPEAAIGGVMKAKSLAKRMGSKAAVAVSEKANAVHKEAEAGGALAWARAGKTEKGR